MCRDLAEAGGFDARHRQNQHRAKPRASWGQQQGPCQAFPCDFPLREGMPPGATSIPTISLFSMTSTLSAIRRAIGSIRLAATPPQLRPCPSTPAAAPTWEDLLGRR